jgi:hypothetical protein
MRSLEHMEGLSACTQNFRTGATRHLVTFSASVYRPRSFGRPGASPSGSGGLGSGEPQSPGFDPAFAEEASAVFASLDDEASTSEAHAPAEGLPHLLFLSKFQFTDGWLMSEQTTAV